jgi:thymidylate synthase
MNVYNRSSDIILGLPFNIVWQTLLLYHICYHVGKIKPGKIFITIGNAHIYQNHLDLLNK